MFAHSAALSIKSKGQPTWQIIYRFFWSFCSLRSFLMVPRLLLCSTVVSHELEHPFSNTLCQATHGLIWILKQFYTAHSYNWAIVATVRIQMGDHRYALQLCTNVTPQCDPNWWCHLEASAEQQRLDSEATLRSFWPYTCSLSIRTFNCNFRAKHKHQW